MKQTSLLVIFGFAIFLTGCKKVFPEGPAIRETRQTAVFDKIELAFSGDIVYTQQAAHQVEIEAAQNILPYIITETKGSKLVLKTRPNVNIAGGKVTLYISSPDFSEAVITGSGNFNSVASVSGSSVVLKVTGSGDISIPRLTATQLKAEITGSGNISIQDGSVQKQDLAVTGNGDYYAVDMSSEEALVRISGSGGARLWAHQTLQVTISGSGDVWYKGTPGITSSVSGSGKLRKL